MNLARSCQMAQVASAKFMALYFRWFLLFVLKFRVVFGSGVCLASLGFFVG